MRALLRAFIVTVALAASFGARAEVGEVRLSKQYGLPYLPFMVMEQFSLLEKQAEKQGLKLKVSWTTLSNSTAMMEAILSGQMDFISPGLPTLATMWDKTVGTPNEIRALSAIQSMPYVLVTREDRIKTIRDFTTQDRIALPKECPQCHFLKAPRTGKCPNCGFTCEAHYWIAFPSAPKRCNLLWSGVR